MWISQFFFFFLLCLSIVLLLFLLRCHYLNPSFYFLPQEMGVRRMLEWGLAVGCPSTGMILYFFICVSHIQYRCQKALLNAVRKNLLKFWTVPNFLKICLCSLGFFMKNMTNSVLANIPGEPQINCYKSRIYTFIFLSLPSTLTQKWERNSP